MKLMNGDIMIAQIIGLAAGFGLGLHPALVPVTPESSVKDEIGAVYIEYLAQIGS